MRVVLRCALTKYGARYQTMAGLSMMLLLCVDNLDTAINVRERCTRNVPYTFYTSCYLACTL